MALILLAVLLFVPLIEVALFIVVGSQIGVAATIGLCLLTAVMGAFLVRRQGLGLLLRARAELQAGHVPAGAAAEGALIVLAGLFLITPGFFSDAVGFLLLVPPVRRFVIAQMAKRYGDHFGVVRGAAFHASDSGIVIDGEASEVRPPGERLTSPWKR